MRVRERATRDPGGKVVDLYPRVLQISSIAFAPPPGFTDEDLRELVLSVFERIAGSGVRRVRDRDVPVYFGRFSTPNDDLASLGLPEPLLVEVHFLFQDAIRSVTEIREIGATMMEDVGATPFGRYSSGSYVFYTDSLEKAAEEKLGWEWRSFELEEPTPAEVRRTPLPGIDFKADTYHDLETWLTLGPQIAGVIAEMTGPTSYRSLRLAAKEHFGLQVREVGDGFPYFGSLYAGWLTEDGCTVTILLRASMPAQLKYVVLAHELAHFVRHFPLIYLNQAAEQVSWSHPSFETRYRRLVEDTLGPRERIEQDANSFATYFLLPPFFDLEQMAALIFERSAPLSPQELGWRLLQSHFPDGGLTESSWAEIDAQKDRLRSDLLTSVDGDSTDADSLHIAMLAALLARQDEEAEQLSDEIQEQLGVLTTEFQSLLASAGDLGARRPDAEIESSEELGAMRRILPPRDGSPAGAAERVPLSPTSANRLADQDGNWRSPMAPSLRGAPVPTWRQKYSERAIILYPMQTSLPVERNGR